MENQYDLSHLLGHAFSAGAIGLGFIGWLPFFATLGASMVAFIWYSIQIYESVSVQKWLKSRKLRRIRRLKRLLAHLDVDDRPEHH